MIEMMIDNRVKRALRLTGVMVLCVLLTACGVRLETPPPIPLSPGANEVARQSAVDSIVAIEEYALELTEYGDDEVMQELIALIASQADAHVDALGGTYDSGLEVEPTEPAIPPIDDAIPPELEDLHTMLVQSALRIRATLPLVEDDHLARLLSSISLSHSLLAYDLGDLAGIDTDIDEVAYESAQSAGDIAEDATRVIEDLAQTTPSPSPGADEVIDEAESPVITRQTRDTRVPVELPEGLDHELLVPVIVDEDALGYIQELRAARLEDEARDVQLERAVLHRNRASDWIGLTDLGFTDNDPRHVRYSVHADLTGEDVVAELDTQIAAQLHALTNHYVSLIPAAQAPDRTMLHDLALSSMLEGRQAGHDFGTFPGMPDLRG